MQPECTFSKGHFASLNCQVVTCPVKLFVNGKKSTVTPRRFANCSSRAFSEPAMAAPNRFPNSCRQHSPQARHLNNVCILGMFKLNPLGLNPKEMNGNASS